MEKKHPENTCGPYLARQRAYITKQVGNVDSFY